MEETRKESPCGEIILPSTEEIPYPEEVKERSWTRALDRERGPTKSQVRRRRIQDVKKNESNK